jgi:hypothetical protein
MANIMYHMDIFLSRGGGGTYTHERPSVSILSRPRYERGRTT